MTHPIAGAYGRVAQPEEVGRCFFQEVLVISYATNDRCFDKFRYFDGV